MSDQVRQEEIQEPALKVIPVSANVWVFFAYAEHKVRDVQGVVRREEGCRQVPSESDCALGFVDLHGCRQVEFGIGVCVGLLSWFRRGWYDQHCGASSMLRFGYIPALPV